LWSFGGPKAERITTSRDNRARVPKSASSPSAAARGFLDDRDAGALGRAQAEADTPTRIERDATVAALLRSFGDVHFGDRPRTPAVGGPPRGEHALVAFERDDIQHAVEVVREHDVADVDRFEFIGGGKFELAETVAAVFGAKHHGAHGLSPLTGRSADSAEPRAMSVRDVYGRNPKSGHRPGFVADAAPVAGPVLALQNDAFETAVAMLQRTDDPRVPRRRARDGERFERGVVRLDDGRGLEMGPGARDEGEGGAGREKQSFHGVPFHGPRERGLPRSSAFLRRRLNLHGRNDLRRPGG
jgi:hypothetical protein